MYLKLRILFTILSALCLAAILPIAVWTGTVWFAVDAVGALFFFAMTLLCKQSQEKQEEEKKKKDRSPEPDFLSPRTKTDENLEE